MRGDDRVGDGSGRRETVNRYVGRWSENDFPQLVFRKGIQNPRASTPRRSIEPSIPVQSIAREPTLDGSAVCSESLRDNGDCHAALDCFDRALPNFIGGVRRFRCHASDIGSCDKEV